MEQLYIRHTVGGTLFYDSRQIEAGFTRMEEPAGGGAAGRTGERGSTVTVFTLFEVPPAAAEELLRYREELNLFLVEEGVASRKSWFYTSGGEVAYEPDTRQIVIRADVRLDYTV